MNCVDELVLLNVACLDICCKRIPFRCCTHCVILLKLSALYYVWANVDVYGDISYDVPKLIVDWDIVAKTDIKFKHWFGCDRIKIFASLC